MVVEAAAVVCAHTKWIVREVETNSVVLYVCMGDNYSGSGPLRLLERGGITDRGSQLNKDLLYDEDGLKMHGRSSVGGCVDVGVTWLVSLRCAGIGAISTGTRRDSSAV